MMKLQLPTLWPPDVKSQFIGKDPDVGKDWKQEEKRAIEDKIVGWHHWLYEHESDKLWEMVKDREAWRAVVYGIAKSRTCLRDWTTTTIYVYVLRYFSCVQIFATLWTVTCQAPLFMGFSRQEYWSGLPISHPGDLPDPRIEPASLMPPALAGRVFTTSATCEVPPITPMNNSWSSPLLPSTMKSL